MMKKLAAASLLMAIFGLAHADGVTLYGVLDAGVVQETNNGNFNPTFVTGSNPTGAVASGGGTTLGMMNGGEAPTRWGIMGREDLSNGRSAFFKLESGFSVGTGALATSGLVTGNTFNNAADTSLNGQLFGRTAQVGIADNNLGTVTLGRMNNLMLDNIPGYDPVNAQMFSPINFSGSYGGGGETDNGRVDNAVKYTKNVMGVTVNALYGFGGMSNNNVARNQTQLGLGYEQGRFGVQGVYEVVHDTSAVAANTANTVKATFYDLRATMLTARYDLLKNVTVKAGWEHRDFQTPSDYTADQTLVSIYGYSIGATAAGTAKTDNTYWVGANYQVNPSNKISVGYYTTRTDAVGTTTAANSANYSSVVYDYYLSKRTNLYAGVMNVNKTGVNTATAHDTWWTYGAGVVHKF